MGVLLCIRNLSTPTGEQAPINTPEAKGGTVSNRGSAPQTLLAAVTDKSATLPISRVTLYGHNVNSRFS